MKFEYFFLNLPRKFKFITDKNNGYFTRRPVYIYDNIWLSSTYNEECCKQICGENQNTHFMLNNIFKIVLQFMR